MRREVSAFVASLTVVCGVHADIRTLRFDMPSNLGIFGLEWQQDFLEPVFDGLVAEARLIVTFDTTQGVRPFHDAADILFQHQLATTTVPFWNVRGSDLGWSGTGRFTAALSTHAFDGQSLINKGEFTLWFGRIVSDNEKQPLLGGLLTDSYWEFDVNEVPSPGAGLSFGVGMLALGGRRSRRQPRNDRC